MNNNNTLSFFSGMLFGVGFFAINSSVYASEGAGLFQQHCARCHQSTSRINNTPEKLTELLHGDSIKQHRFNLDEPAIRAIVDYITEQKS